MSFKILQTMRNPTIVQAQVISNHCWGKKRKLSLIKGRPKNNYPNNKTRPNNKTSNKLHLN